MTNDVQIAIEHCGVCHTDIHFVNNDWGMTNYRLSQVMRLWVGSPKLDQQYPSLRLEINLPSVAWSIRAEFAQIVRMDTSSIASTDLPQLQLRNKGPRWFYLRRVFPKYRCPGILCPQSSRQPQRTGNRPLLCAGITTYSPLRNWKDRS